MGRLCQRIRHDRQSAQQNYLAWGVLRHLGFRDSTDGNVVLTRKDKKPFTAADLAKFESARLAYLKEIGTDEEALLS